MTGDVNRTNGQTPQKRSIGWFGGMLLYLRFGTIRDPARKESLDYTKSTAVSLTVYYQK